MKLSVIFRGVLPYKKDGGSCRRFLELIRQFCYLLGSSTTQGSQGELSLHLLVYSAEIEYDRRYLIINSMRRRYSK